VPDGPSPAHSSLSKGCCLLSGALQPHPDPPSPLRLCLGSVINAGRCILVRLVPKTSQVDLDTLVSSSSSTSLSFHCHRLAFFIFALSFRDLFSAYLGSVACVSAVNVHSFLPYLIIARFTSPSSNPQDPTPTFPPKHTAMRLLANEKTRQ
jgi:hypothetical protein